MSVAEGPAGEVRRVDGDGRRFDDVVRGGRLGAGRHLVVGGPEVLDLELVPEAVVATGDALHGEIDEGLAGVGSLGELDRDVEAAERVQFGRSAPEFVALRVVRRVPHGR